MTDEKKEPTMYGEYAADGSIATNEDGSKKYPDVDITGASFTLPATIYNVDENRFVVLPTNFSNAERLAEIKAQAAPVQPRADFRRTPTPTENKEGE